MCVSTHRSSDTQLVVFLETTRAPRTGTSGRSLGSGVYARVSREAFTREGLRTGADTLSSGRPRRYNHGRPVHDGEEGKATGQTSVRQ